MPRIGKGVIKGERISENKIELLLKILSDYKTETEILLERLVESAEREDYRNAIQTTLDEMKEKISVEKKKDIEKNRSEIEEMLKVEIVTRYYYQKGKIESSLVNDPDILEALKVIGDNALYSSILDGSYNSQK